MKLKKFYRTSQGPKLLSLITACAMLLSLIPAAVTASGSAAEYQVVVIGGEHGQISYDGSTKNSQTFTVANGGTLPDGIEVIPDSGYVFTGFKFSSKIKKFCTGKRHTVVLTEDGKVYAAGSNQYGQLGTGDNLDHSVFTEVTTLSGKTITDIAVGDEFTIALTVDGKLYATGSNDSGQLGMGNTQHCKSFTEVTSLSGKNITAIAAGQMYSIVAASDSTVHATGHNGSGQLGLGDNYQRNSFAEVTSLSGKTITSIVAGSQFSFVITTDGLYASGANYRGQLGLGNTNNNYKSFTEVTFFEGKTIVDAAAAPYHSAVVTSDGSLYVTGWNPYNQLGFPSSTEIYSSFTEVTYLAEKNVTSVIAGDYSTAALTSDGQAYFTGYNSKSELGASNLSSQVFTQISGLNGKNIVAMDIGYGRSVAGASDGSFYAVGFYGGLDSETLPVNYTKITYTPWFRPINSFSEITVNSNIIAEAIYKSITSMNLSVAPADARYPQNIELIADLSGAGSISDKTVDFYNGGTLLGSAVTNATGKAVYTITNPDSGSYSYKAVFTGDSTHASAQSNTVSYTVSPGDQELLTLNGVPSSKTYGDDSFSISVSGGSGDGAITFESSNPAVATVDNNGNVTIIGAGTFTITARKAESENYMEASVTSEEITVYKKALTMDDLIYTGSSDLVYNGSAKIGLADFKDGLIGTGTITVKYYIGATEVSEAIDAGTYTVKADITEGINYTEVLGLKLGTFTIDKASQTKPDMPSVINPTTLANNDGKITGVDSSMEYQKRVDINWNTVDGTEITGLSEGTYYVRYAASNNYNESEAIELTLTKYVGTPEITPNVSFSAAPRTLSGSESGQKFRIDNGLWQDIINDLSAVVTKGCTIELYMPGDGIYTTDSGIQTITVTKAEKPEITGINETIQGKNDGEITGVNTAMEYKTDGGAWTSVTMPILDELAPGTYYVRVKADDTTLESDAVSVTIGPGEPEFFEKTIADNTSKLSVTGQFTNEAALQVEPITTGSTSYNNLIKLVDTDKNEVVAAYEISIIDGSFTGKLDLVFNIGSEYNGKTFTIYYEKNSGKTEKYTAVCTEGKISIAIDALSPFLITIAAQADSDDDNNSDNGSSMPQTGDSSNLIIWMILASLTAIALILIIAVTKKKNKSSN